VLWLKVEGFTALGLPLLSILVLAMALNEVLHSAAGAHLSAHSDVPANTRALALPRQRTSERSFCRRRFQITSEAPASAC
jgi:hypothetical protein